MDELPSGAIVVRDSNRQYGESQALNEIEINLDEGQTSAVLGPNGSGKSTLLRILATLLRPTRGEVSIFGCELPKENWKLHRRIGYLGHVPLLYEDLTGRENLEFHARLHGLGKEEATARIDSDLESMEMLHRANDRVGQFSAGMKQRIAVCRAVLHRPDLFLLDEPDSNLDPEGRDLSRRLIGPGDGRTRVLVSHEPDRARAEADQVMELDRTGRIASSTMATAGETRVVPPSGGHP